MTTVQTPSEARRFTATITRVLVDGMSIDLKRLARMFEALTHGRPVRVSRMRAAYRARRRGRW